MRMRGAWLLFFPVPLHPLGPVLSCCATCHGYSHMRTEDKITYTRAACWMPSGNISPWLIGCPLISYVLQRIRMCVCNPLWLSRRHLPHLGSIHAEDSSTPLLLLHSCWCWVDWLQLTRSSTRFPELRLICTSLFIFILSRVRSGCQVRHVVRCGRDHQYVL